MSIDVPTSHTRASVPAIGRWLPTATVPLAYLAVAVVLCALVLASPFWRGAGVVLAVAATVAPRLVAWWWLLVVLGLSQLWRTPSATDGVFYLLLAGVHLLHVLGSMARLLPWHGRMQVGALARPLQRYLLVQLVAQPVALGALLVFTDARGHVPGLSIFAAVVLASVVAVLARGLRQAARRG